jgi:hypothetical protein
LVALFTFPTIHVVSTAIANLLNGNAWLPPLTQAADLAYTLFITILFSWVYNRTYGTILAPAIFHASMNAMNPLAGIMPITAAGNILLVGFALFVVFSDRMWRRLPADHPAVHHDLVPSTSATRSVQQLAGRFLSSVNSPRKKNTPVCCS